MISTDEDLWQFMFSYITRIQELRINAKSEPVQNDSVKTSYWAQKRTHDNQNCETDAALIMGWSLRSY